MSDKKKIAVIIPDGVGIKNYLYSKFTQHLKKKQYGDFNPFRF